MIKRLFILIVSALFLIGVTGCEQTHEKPYVTKNNDTISRAFLITDVKVGHLMKGMGADRLQKEYGNNFVKLMPQTNLDTEEDKAKKEEHLQYYVYNKNNRLLFVAKALKKEDEVANIQQIDIKDKQFRTTKNIGIGSTIEDIKKAYTEYDVIMQSKNVLLYLPEFNGTFTIPNRYVKGWNKDLIGELSIDSIIPTYKVTNLSLNWMNQQYGMFEGKFWKEATHKFLAWVIVELPSILILVALFIGLLRLLTFVIKRVQGIAFNRVEKDSTIDTYEAHKRINTLSGIVHGLGKIFLWTIFLLILLSKFNINIAPIIASAGIVGLAVGFGAQELVRDFISGFFILLEDQLRTGDMAIINGTTGVVEKIQMRTITLRDMSGVVHIFQNGKINTLSNMTKEWSAIVLEIGVAYKEDIDRVMKLMQEVGDEMYNIDEYKIKMLSSIEVLGLDNFGDSAIVIKAVLKTRPMQQWAIKREYQRRLKIVFDKEGVEIPFPHLSIYTGEVTKPYPIEILQQNHKDEIEEAKTAE